MRGDTKERWRELCEGAVVEQDPERFVATIQELLQALEQKKEARLRIPIELPGPPTERPTKLSCPVA